MVVEEVAALGSGWDSKVCGLGMASYGGMCSLLLVTAPSAGGRMVGGGLPRPWLPMGGATFPTPVTSISPLVPLPVQWLLTMGG